MMIKVIILSLGGVVGVLLRYFTGGAVHRVAGGGFPYGTLVINLTGCLIIGLLWGIFERFEFSSNLRLFLFIGVLGSFTTFSSFGLETFNLLRDNELRLGIYNMVITNVFGLGLVYLGYFSSRFLINIFK
jgi:CrcB protein